MNPEKSIKIRMYVLLIAGVVAFGLGLINLSRGNDMFAIINFAIGVVSIFSYHKLHQRFFNKEKTWKSGGTYYR